MKRVVLMLALACCWCGVAVADEQTSCDTECGPGEVRVGYADGNGSSCQCAVAAEVQNPEIPEAGEAYDGQSS